MKRGAIFLFLILSAAAALAQAPPYTAAIVVEPTTGQILFEQNAHQAFATASMTKMMSLMIVMDAIKEKTLTWDTPVIVSAKASKMGGSQVYLKQGESFPVRDLVAATMVHSANDAAMALAEQVAGTGEAFVSMMNQKAAQLGLKNSHYYSPHGLPGEGVPDDVMSPWDCARLGIELMKAPEMKKLAVIQQAPFRNGSFTMYNPNHLLKIFPGATGIKTGFHGKAGFCVTGSARRGDMDLVVVVMGSRNKKDNFGSAAKLLSEAFAVYKMTSVVAKGSPLPTAVTVRDGAEDTVPAVAGADARVLLKRSEKPNVAVTVSSGGVSAPVRKGQQIGVAIVKQNGKQIARIPALAAADVAEESWFAKMWETIWPF